MICTSLVTQYENCLCERGFISVIIAASLDGFVVFVEVKTRLGDKYGRPSEAVNFAKQRKYRMIAMQFLNQNGLIDAPIRFDIIEITPQEINHIENAF